MLVLLTTANYPDVMMPAYTRNRAWSLYFIIYLIVGLFFMLNLVLATVCDSFREMLNDHDKQRLSQRVASLNASFRMLRRVDILLSSRPKVSSEQKEELDEHVPSRKQDENEEEEEITLSTYAALQRELERKKLTLFSEEEDKIFSSSAEDLALTYPNLSSKPIDRERFEHLLETSLVIRNHRKNLRSRYRDVDPWEFDVVIRQLWSCLCGERVYVVFFVSIERFRFF